MCHFWKREEIRASCKECIFGRTVNSTPKWLITQHISEFFDYIYTVPACGTLCIYIHFIMFTIIQYIFMHIVVQNLLRLHHPSPNPNFPDLTGASHLHCSRCLILQLAAFASWATHRDLTQGPRAGPGGEARQLTSNQTKSMVGWFQESMDGVLL